jgi:hypothetical protein
MVASGSRRSGYRFWSGRRSATEQHGGAGHRVRADEDAVYAAVDAGNGAVATAMIDARRLSLSSLQLAIKARQRAFDAGQTADRIEAGTLASNRSAQEERARAALLNELADRVDPTL